jgi:hypothetical protein
MSDKIRSDFEKAALDRKGTSLVHEFWYFLRQNKKWWLAPMLLILLFFSLLLVLGGTAVAPLIYTLF